MSYVIILHTLIFGISKVTNFYSIENMLVYGGTNSEC